MKQPAGRKERRRRNGRDGLLHTRSTLLVAIFGSLITAIATFGGGYLTARAQLGTQRDLIEQQQGNQLRERRNEVYPQLLDEARSIARLTNEVYAQCPDDPTPDGCDGDRRAIEEARDRFARAQGIVGAWGSAKAIEKAEELRNSLPTTSRGCEAPPLNATPPKTPGFTSSSAMCVARSLSRLPSGKLVGPGGEIVPEKKVPDSLLFNRALDQFEDAMKCDLRDPKTQPLPDGCS